MFGSTTARVAGRLASRRTTVVRSKFTTGNQFNQTFTRSFASFERVSSSSSSMSLAMKGLVAVAGFSTIAYAFASNKASAAETAAPAATPAPVETVSEVVGKASELNNGEMKQVVVNGIKILLSKVDGQYYATDLNCTHYGAPLNTGVLSGDRVICPWHNAAFNVKTGNLENDGGPATNHLNTYQVKVEGDDIVVTVPKVPPPKKTPSGRACRCHDKRTFVIVGSGGAGAIAAETLRQDGFKGQLIIVTNDNELPYDRTSLSKGFGTPVEKILLRSEEFYKTNGIQVHRGREVDRVDNNEKLVYFKDGSSISYDSLLLATGASARQIPIPGGELENIFTLRSAADNFAIADAAKQAKKVVIVGTGFIGMEAASALKMANKELEIVLLDIVKTPFETILGAEVGAALMKHHSDNGVQFRMGKTVKQFVGDSQVRQVELNDGEILDADFVILGLGVVPNTTIIKGVEKTPAGYVVVNENLKTSDPNIFAAGDITNFPYKDGRAQIGHWAVSQNQGRVAAHNMVGNAIPFKNLTPFFWTRSFNATLQFVGYAPKIDEVIIKGDPVAKKFVAFYIHNNKVAAVAAMGAPAAGAAASELLRLDKFPSPEELKAASEVNLPQILKKVLQEQQ